MIRSIAVAAILAAGLAVPVTASNRTASLFVHVWHPELGPLPGSLDENEQRLAQVAAFALAGDFRRAGEGLQGLEAIHSDPRLSYLVPLFQKELIVRRADYLGDTRGQSDSNRGMEDARAMLEQGNLMVRAMAAASEAAESHRETAGAIIGFQSLSAVCISGPWPYRDVSQQVRELPELSTATAGGSLAAIFARCDSMAADLRTTVQGGLLEPDEQVLIEELIRARLAWSERDTAQSRIHLQRGIEICLAHDWKRALATWLLLLGDLDAAPFGSPLTFGYGLSTETHVRKTIEADVYSAARMPVPAEALRRAGEAYARAASLSSQVPGLAAELKIREAYLAYRAKGTAGSLYEAAAQTALAGHSPRIAIAALGCEALLGAQGEVFKRAVRLAADSGYEGALLSLVEMVHSFALRLYTDGDRFGAAARLAAARPALLELGTGLAAVPLLSFAASIEAESGRDDVAIDLYRTIGDLQRAHLQETLRAKQELEKQRPGGTEWTYLSAELMSLASNYSSLTLALGRKFAAEGLAIWRAQGSSNRYEFLHTLTEFAAALPPEAKLSFDLESAARKMVDSLAEVTRQFEQTQEVRRRLEQGKNCEVVRRDAEIMLRDAVLAGNKRAGLQVMTAAAPCYAEMMMQARAELMRLDPVGEFVRAIEQKKAAPGYDTNHALIAAMVNLRNDATFARRADSGQLLQGWMRRLIPAIPQDPHFTEFAHWAQLELAIAAGMLGNPMDARGILQAIAAGPFWSGAADPDFRYQVRLQLVDAEVAMENAEAALLAAAQADAERGALLAFQSGIPPDDPSAAEAAMLTRQSAVQGTVGPHDAERLNQLRGSKTGTGLVAGTPPTAAQLQESLRSIPRDTTLLVYLTLGSKLVIWRVEPRGRISMVKASTDAAGVLRRARLLRQELTDGVDTWQTVARQLYGELIAPAGPLAAGSVLAIAGFDRLAGLPFDALLDRDGRPLMASHPLLYLSSLVNRPSPPNAMAGRRLVVGLDGPSLTLAEREASMAAQLLGTTALTGERATLAAVRAALPGAGWAHLSTHAVVDERNPYLSYLQLADGRLNAWEVFAGLRSAEMLALSACDAMRGLQPLANDAMQGSTSIAAFAARTGVRRVLATSWKVDERDALEVMRDFYRGMLADPSQPARRLHEAKLKHIDLGPQVFANFSLTVQDPSALLFAGPISDGRR